MRRALDLCGLELILTTEQLVVRPTKRSVAWPDSHRPRFRGAPADHLSISLEPCGQGPYAGRYTIHLTWIGPGGKRSHEYLAEFTPEEVKRWGTLLEREIVRAHLAGLERVTKSGLRAQGWLVVEPMSPLMDGFIAEVKKGKRKRKYWVTEELVENFFGELREGMRLATPSRLDWYRGRHPEWPMQLVRVDEGGEIESAYAFHYDHPKMRGWFLDRGNVLERLRVSGGLCRLLGPSWDALMLIILRELQADCEVDEIIARASVVDAR